MKRLLMGLILMIGFAGINGCGSGKNGKDGINGVDGRDGKDGINGVDGGDGLTVETVYNVYSDGQDLCTRYSNENCFFAGGKLVKFSNGTYQIEGQIWYSYYNTGDKDTDYIRTYNSMWSLNSDTIVWVGLGAYSRTGSDYARMISLLFDPTNETLYLMYDSDNNQTIDNNDVIIETLTKIEI